MKAFGRNEFCGFHTVDDVYPDAGDGMLLGHGRRSKKEVRRLMKKKMRKQFKKELHDEVTKSL